MTPVERLRRSSQYLDMLLAARPETEDWLAGEETVHRSWPREELQGDLRACAEGAGSFQDLQRAFRRFKQRHFLRLGLRDLQGWANLEEVTAGLSDVACVALRVGLEWLGEKPLWWTDGQGASRWTELRRDLRLVVVGLGKLGGRELNYVSDVDLLYLHEAPPAPGDEGGERILLMDRLCRWLARLLADPVDGDRVFQVDLRLRPGGKDGPLVPSMSGAAEYYLFHGVLWERQMLLKARPAAGDIALGDAFLREVRPFVFRRFLDFQALDEIRRMRDRILREAPRPKPGWDGFDVKLGRGGIREIEFMVQSFQLIYGGRHAGLEAPSTLGCLERIRKLELLPGEVVDELERAYVFLRRTEHWIQLDQNRQTQKLPRSSAARERLALALGFDGGQGAFFKELGRWCEAVHGHFEALFEERSSGSSSGEVVTGELCQGGFEREFPAEWQRLAVHLEVFPPSFQERVLESLCSLDHLKDRETLAGSAARLEAYLGRVRRRPGLLRLFRTESPWCRSLCRGLARSELVGDLLSRQPSLVEGVASWGGKCPEAADWEQTGDSILAPHSSYEEGVEWIRRLKNERLLQLALADLDGALPPENLEGELSRLADYVLRRTYEFILESRGLGGDLPLCVLGLGRLGGRRMSYLSELELAFVYRRPPGASEEGIPADAIRLIQRFLRMLSTPLQEGPGYAVGAPLRPSGNYGPLVVALDAWEDYHTHRADAGDMRALLEARVVCGEASLGRLVEEKAREWSRKPRDGDEVRSSLCRLRRRMEREGASGGARGESLTLGEGGLADLELWAQGWRLIRGLGDGDAESRDMGGMLRKALLETAHVGEAAERVLKDYQALRFLEHRVHLGFNRAGAHLDEAGWEALGGLGLLPSAGEGFPVASRGDLGRLRGRVRALWRELCGRHDVD